jgi:hypothetical protein
VIAFVEAQIGYLLTKTFTFLGTNWASFETSFAWLCTKLIDLMTRQASSFATSLWGLLEAVLNKINL